MDYNPSMDALRRKLDAALQQSLGDIRHFVSFTLQRDYFKCSYECFDRQRSSEEITNCVERCSIPVQQANSLVENELARFQDRLSRSLMVCQDRLEARNMLKQPTDSAQGFMGEFEHCIEDTVKDYINMMPHLAEKIKSQMPKQADIRNY